MTTVEILFRYTGLPSEPEVFALANAREVYGIRRLEFNRQASTLLVEYDATRLTAATVTALIRRSGLQLTEQLPPPPPIPATELPPEIVVPSPQPSVSQVPTPHPQKP